MESNFKGKKSMSLLIKLTGISTVFILVAIVALSVIGVTSMQKSSMETSTIMGNDMLTADMQYFENLIAEEYGQLRIVDRVLSGQDSVSLYKNYDLVDRIGATMGVIATIFIKEGNDYRRISTNILDATGNREVDTFLGSGSPAFANISAGNEYRGETVIFDRFFYTLYRPIFSPDSRHVIGIIFIGVDMSKIKQTIRQNTAHEIFLFAIISGAILLTLVVVNVMSMKYILIKPIKEVTKIIHKLSMGDVNFEVTETQTHDEIGVMKNELIKLFKGIKETAHFAEDIGKGNLDAQFEPMSEIDVLGNALLEMRKSIRDAEIERTTRAKEEEQRNWGTSGLAKFAEILRNDNTNMEALTYNIISNLVKYLGANQGGIFVMNDAEHEDEKFLELKACYAYDRQKFTEKHIQPGEGLIGSCYLEGELIYMTSVPENYINITSGLGDANPKAVLICPLKVNDDVYGVIEFASFEKLEPYKIEFVQKVSESIASTISSVRINIRTEKLLAQSKIQAEEMANAEEELRQTMEEMQATQEESRRREIEQQDALAKMSEEIERYRLEME